VRTWTDVLLFSRRWTRGSCADPWKAVGAPGYYYVLFDDPDGIRLEVNFVPGAGLLADGVQFNAATG